MKNTCLWTDVSGDSPSYPVLKSSINTEVCIIGAGYTGLSTALHLAEKGVSSIVLEANHIGHGGSGRNVGYVNAGLWMKPSEVESALGVDAGRKLNQELGEAPKLVFELIERYGIDAQETRTGNLQIAHNDATEADIKERYRQWRIRKQDVELISAKECQQMIGTSRARLALKCNRSGTLNPYAYVVGLAQAASRCGVKIYEKSPVAALKKLRKSGSQQWRIVTQNNATVIANKVVIATNAYTEGEWTNILQTMFKVNYYQIASEPLNKEISQMILGERQGVADTRTVLSSMRRDKDGRLILGTVGSHYGKPEKLMPAWADRVTEYYFPQLGKLNWQYQWTGQFGFTSDHLMRIFEPVPGILAATAFNGRGITTGTLFGKAFAAYLLSENSDDLPLPMTELSNNLQGFTCAKSFFYEAGVTLYHAGQCLRIII